MEVQAGIKRTAAMVVLRSGREFLLLKRNKAPNAGMYVPVGGKIDPHERPLETAIRETEEETGIQLQAADLHYGGLLSETSPLNYNWICFIYIADIQRIDAPLCDEGILEWIPFDKVANLPTPPTDMKIYEYLLNQIPFALDASYDDQLRLVSMREEISGEIVYSINAK